MAEDILENSSNPKTLRGTDNIDLSQARMSPEVLSQVARFTPEQKKFLEEKSFIIYELTGQSIASLKEKGMKFWEHTDSSLFEPLISRKSEVAILPSLILPGSEGKTFSTQEYVVDVFSNFIASKLPGVKAIIGEVADYAELTFLSPEEDRLFGKRYGDPVVRTKTKLNSHVVVVGKFRPGNDSEFGLNGLDILEWYPDNSEGICIAPIIVPVRIAQSAQAA